MELKVIDFIKRHKDWEWLLSKQPYCLKISHDEGLVMLKYDMLNSDMSNEIVQECRGIILQDKTWKIISVKFWKFWNYNEPLNHTQIDWNNCEVQTKVDGSLIGLVYYKDKWLVSTNGTIDAFKANINNGITGLISPYKTFGELFAYVRKEKGLDYDKLNKNYCYMFELVSPYNKQVVNYKKPDIYHIGTRDMTTLQELDIDIGIQKPKRYPLKTLEQCIEVANTFKGEQEGFVVVDKNWNRIKIKSPYYFVASKIRNNGNISYKALVELIKKGDTQEFLSYFPEFSKVVLDIQIKVNQILGQIEWNQKRLNLMSFDTKKEFAEMVLKMNYNDYYFQWYNNKQLKPEKWFWKLSTPRLIEILNLKERNND